MSDTCPVCDSRLQSVPAILGDATAYHCTRCGRFRLSGTYEAMLSGVRSMNGNATAKLSHAIRRGQREGEAPLVTSYFGEAALAASLPRPKEQADLLIRWLGEHSGALGEFLEIAFETHAAIVGSSSQEALKLVTCPLRLVQ